MHKISFTHMQMQLDHERLHCNQAPIPARPSPIDPRRVRAPCDLARSASHGGSWKLSREISGPGWIQSSMTQNCLNYNLIGSLIGGNVIKILHFYFRDDRNIAASCVGMMIYHKLFMCVIATVDEYLTAITYWGRGKIAAISQTTF